MQKHNKTQWAVGAVALVFGLVAYQLVDGASLGVLVGIALAALVALTAHDAVRVGEALDQPTRMDAVTVAAWAAAEELKKKGKKHARADVGQDERRARIRVQVYITAVRPSAAH